MLRLRTELWTRPFSRSRVLGPMLPPSARAWLPFSLRFSTLSQHAPARARPAARRARRGACRTSICHASARMLNTNTQKSIAVIHENSGGHPEMGVVQTAGARGFESRPAPRLFFWLPRCPSCFFLLPITDQLPGYWRYQLPTTKLLPASRINSQATDTTNWETKTLSESCRDDGERGGRAARARTDADAARAGRRSIE